MYLPVVLYCTGGIYCAVELDEYGKFERKAKTLPVQNDATTLGATWDQVCRVALHDSTIGELSEPT